MLKLSYSKINDFKACPKRFELAHLLGLLPKENENIYTAFGSAVHYAIEQSLNKDLDFTAAYGFFLQKFNDLFLKIPLVKRQTIYKNVWLKKGEEMLTYFFEEIFERAKKGKVETEYYFSQPIDEDTVFNGLIDLIFCENMEDIELWDWKTGKKMDEKDNFQLRLYALFFQKRTELLAKRLNYIFLKTGSKNSTEINLDTLKQTEKELKDIVSNIKTCIKNNDFERNAQSHCKYCPVKDACEQQLKANDPNFNERESGLPFDNPHI